MKNSIDQLGEGLAACMLDIARSIADAINEDPRHKKVDLNRIAKNANKSLSQKGFECIRMYVDQQRRMRVKYLDFDNNGSDNKSD